TLSLLQTPTLGPSSSLLLPLPAIIFITVTAYLLLLLIILGLRQCLLGWARCPPFPRCCPLCDCACAYQPPDCQSINCICFEIKLL
uniref:Uncharacterized protein n=1 Tax=Pelusios castaneus TaxID=367368 RepID=A0A8C8VLA5_9SAUR